MLAQPAQPQGGTIASKIAPANEFSRPRPAERAARRQAFHAALVPDEAGAEHFDVLKKHFDEGQIVEIVATIALFGYLNRWNDKMATTLEARAVAAADRAIGAVGWMAGKLGG